MALAAEARAHALEAALARASSQAEGPWRRPPTFVTQSLAFQASADDARALGVRWGRWVTSLEEYFLCALEVPPAARQAYRGRGTLHEPRVVKVRAPKAATPMADRAAAWWASAAALADTLHRQGARTDPAVPVAQGSSIGAQAARLLMEQADQLPRDGPIPLDAAAHAGWRAALREAPTWPPCRADSMRLALTKVADKMERAEVRARLREFRGWLCRAAASAPSRALRWTQPQPLTAQDHLPGVADACGALDAKRAAWEARWRGRATVERLRGLLAACRARAVDDELPSLDVDQFLVVLRGLGTRTGRGTDNLGPADLRAAPRELVADFLDLLGECEARVAWPWQLLVMIVGTLAKPAGGERGVALIPWVMRAWGQLRKPLGSQWCDERAGFWDEAVRGSSALQAGLRRLFMGEAVDRLGV